MSDYQSPEWDDPELEELLRDDPLFRAGEEADPVPPDGSSFFAPPSKDLSAPTPGMPAPADVGDPGAAFGEGSFDATPAEEFIPDFGNAFDNYGAYEGDFDEPAPPPAPPRAAKPEKKRRHFKKFKFPFLLKLAIYFAAVVLASTLLANFTWTLVDDALALSRPNLEVEVRISAADDMDSIAQKLKSVGAIKYERLFKEFCHIKKCEDRFKPGVYTINLNYDYFALTNSLMGTSARETTTIMIAEGLSCDRIFTLLDEQGVCTKSALEQCAAEYHFDEYGFLDGLPYGEPNRLEGYLFPDTYEFYLMDDPERVLGKMLRNFDNKMDEDLMELVEGNELTLHQIITMASIIEGEAANDAERPTIASVMFNRLHNWDYPLLGMDSTVNYGAKLDGVEFEQYHGPYNTYERPGLPVGPINNPGMSSIRAVLHAEETNYYYFATGKDKINHFFTSEAEHDAFVNSDDYIGN